MKFRSLLNYGDKSASYSGKRTRKKYIKKLGTDTEDAELLETGVEDVYDSIQKAAYGIRLEDLVRRSTAGDLSAIPPPVDSFADLSDMPTDILGVHHFILDAKNRFLSLPSEIRSRFNNSFENFLSSYNDGSLSTKLSTTVSSKNPSSNLTEEELTKIRNMIGVNNNA